jgi:predicted alpha/beta superfamily hydrolase
MAKIKRKPNPLTPPETVVVDAEILEKAKEALRTDRVTPVAKCVICQSESAPNSNENLCWVCRRLKISAWRDSDQQVSAQE